MSPRWLWEIWWPSKLISHHQRGEMGREKKKGGTVERCRDRMNRTATSTCGFTGAQKPRVFRSMKGRTFKWYTRALTHKQAHSPPTDVWLRCGRRVCAWEAEEWRFVDQVSAFHVSVTSLCRETTTTTTFQRQLPFSGRHWHRAYSCNIWRKMLKQCKYSFVNSLNL